MPIGVSDGPTITLSTMPTINEAVMDVMWKRFLDGSVKPSLRRYTFLSAPARALLLELMELTFKAGAQLGYSMGASVYGGDEPTDDTPNVSEPKGSGDGYDG